MAFDDLANRMGSTRGGEVGRGSEGLDPDQIIADAVKAARRSRRLSDLILGPIALVGGAGIAVLCYLVATQGALMYGMVFFAIGAIIVGSAKILRGVGLLES
jgi:hypothetical protein